MVTDAREGGLEDVHDSGIVCVGISVIVYSAQSMRGLDLVANADCNQSEGNEGL